MSPRVRYMMGWIVDDTCDKDLQDLLAKIAFAQVQALLVRQLAMTGRAIVQDRSRDMFGAPRIWVCLTHRTFLFAFAGT